MEENMIVNDEVAIALREMVPFTNQSIKGLAGERQGVAQLDFERLRDKYPRIVTKTNRFDIPHCITCDCCLSSQSSFKDRNQIVYCKLCLGGVHIKCHGRQFSYTYSSVMKDFLCERCTYLLDNKSEEEDAVRCRFCDELSGIMIYCMRTE